MNHPNSYADDYMIKKGLVMYIPENIRDAIVRGDDDPEWGRTGREGVLVNHTDLGHANITFVREGNKRTGISLVAEITRPVHYGD